MKLHRKWFGLLIATALVIPSANVSAQDTTLTIAALQGSETEGLQALEPMYEEATGVALARANVDFTGFQSRNLEVEERRLMPRYVEAQFVAGAREVGLRMEPRADGLWRIEHVLADLRSERLQAVGRLGKAESSYRKVTFHKDHLEQDAHLDADPGFRQLLYTHACEAMYADPVYGGNRHSAGWRAIAFPGDVQPRGWTDVEVTGRA